MWASRRRSNRRLVRLIGVMKLLALALPVVSLTILSVPSTAHAAPPNGADSPELRRFENCTELDQYLEDLATEQLRRQMEQWRRWNERGWYGRGGPRYGLKSAAEPPAPSAAP